MIAKDIEGACVLLNQMLARDIEGVSRFFLMNGFVNATVAHDTPFEVEPSAFPHQFALYPLGLLNGLCNETDEQGVVVKRIAVEFDDDSLHIKQFYVEEAADVGDTPPDRQ